MITDKSVIEDFEPGERFSNYFNSLFWRGDVGNGSILKNMVTTLVAIYMFTNLKSWSNQMKNKPSGAKEYEYEFMTHGVAGEGYPFSFLKSFYDTPKDWLPPNKPETWQKSFIIKDDVFQMPEKKGKASCEPWVVFPDDDREKAKDKGEETEGCGYFLASAWNTGYILATAKWLWILSKFSNFVGGYGKYRAVAYPFICLVMLSCYQILSMAASFYISFVHGCIAIIMNTRKMPNIKNIFKAYGFDDEEGKGGGDGAAADNGGNDTSGAVDPFAAVTGMAALVGNQRGNQRGGNNAALVNQLQSIGPLSRVGKVAGNLWDGFWRICKGILAVLTCLVVFLINIGIIMIMCTMLFFFNVMRCFFINIFEMFIPDKGAWTKFKKEHGNNKLFLISLIFIIVVLPIMTNTMSYFKGGEAGDVKILNGIINSNSIYWVGVLVFPLFFLLMSYGQVSGGVEIDTEINKPKNA